LAKPSPRQRYVDFAEQRSQTHVDRSIDDHTQRSTRIVFGNVDQGPGKIRICHGRHGNEKMVGEVDAFHGLILIGGGGGHKGNPCSIPFWSGFGAICVTSITLRLAKPCGEEGASIARFSSIAKFSIPWSGASTDASSSFVNPA
jgi:hypothetical protein